jgi:hypothetical protein
MTKSGFVHAFVPVGASEDVKPHSLNFLDSLSGKRVGFFSNSKINTDALLDTLAAKLAAQYPIEIIRFQKTIPSLAAPEELISRICNQCDAVILAVGD